ncbi:MAG: hypothetical protein GY862_07030 [Gammaproteobacteria bacterium]|nr:hypothetical protein [Gammaproteobacteria bacterium]
MLSKLSKNNVLRIATDGVVESLRMADRELILRALVAFMQLGVAAYEQFNSLDTFLLHAMEELNKLPEEKLERLEYDFINSLKKVKAVFGKYAFRKFSKRGGRRSPLNIALFEAWTICVRDYEQRVLAANKERIIDNFLTLLLSKEFVDAISSSTSSSYQAVFTRFHEIKLLLESTCND